MRKILLVIGIILCLSSCAFGASIVVDYNLDPTSYDIETEAPSIETALNDHSDEDSIEIELVSNATLSETITFSDGYSTVKITGSNRIGNSGSDRHFIIDNPALDITFEGVTIYANSSAGGVQILRAASVTFSDVTFRSINAQDLSDPNGGAVEVLLGSTSHVPVTFTNCHFESCSGAEGGAIYTDGGEVAVSSGTFTGNTASGNGGAIYQAGGILNVSGTTTFTSNTASGNGGAIYPAGGQSTFSETTAFTRNTAEYGGAIYFIDGSMTFSGGASFDNNMANVHGGALCTEQDSLGTLRFIARASFNNNISDYNLDGDGNGGAIWWGMSTAFKNVFTAGADFTNNSARGGQNAIDNNMGNGGAIYIASSSEFVLGDGVSYTFSGNWASNMGGSIYTESAPVKIIGVDLENDSGSTNANAFKGGFIYSSNGKITIENSSLSGYRVSENGGAVCVEEEAKLEITSSKFAGNYAANWGGAILSKNATENNTDTTATITDAYFLDNEATQGGAIYFDSWSNATIENGEFTNNSATSQGGAIRAVGRLAVEKSYFNANRAATDGGALYFELGTGAVSLTSSAFINNKAGSIGGALGLSANSVEIDSCTFDNNSASGGNAVGGAVYLNVSTRSAQGSIENSTFVRNKVEKGTENCGGALAIEGNASIVSCTFTYANEATSSGGAVYVNNGTSSYTVLIAGSIIVGNRAPVGADVFASQNTNIKVDVGYNRVGIYGINAGHALWSSVGAATDRSVESWTTATFFTNNDLADNIVNDDCPPIIGSSFTDETRLQTLMLNEAEDLPEANRATSAIPYSEMYEFPALDQRGLDRRSSGGPLDIGSVNFPDNEGGNANEPITTYSIKSITISGIPNTIKSVGTTASLIAIIRYTNDRTAYGGTASGCEPVTWTSSAPSIIAIDASRGNIIAKAAGQATITVRTTRTTAGGVQATASRIVRVESIPATYMNTVSQQYQNYFATYIEQISEHDLSLSLADVSTSAVKATSFQRNFKAVWPVTSATLVTDLRSSTPTFSTASTYSTSDGLSSSKNAAVSINFQNRNTGDIFPLVYSWNFSGDEIKALLGSDLTGQAANASLAAKLFGALRIDYQTATRSYPVIGSGGVNASEAYQYGALAITKADADRGVHVEITAYLANVAATGSNDGPQIVKGAGSTRLLVVPDGADDGAITGTMWMAQKASSSNTGGNTNTNTNTGTNTNNGGSSSGGEGGGGGGGCSVLGLGLLGAVVLFMKRR